MSYSGSVIWSQGTIGDSVITNLGSIAKKPIDPLTNDEYTYSLAANGVEYQLATALEKEKDSDPTASFIQKANAATGDAFAKVLWNYNGIVIFANTGGIDYGLAVPSLISWDLSTREIATTIARKKLSYNTFSAVPSKLAHAYTSGNFDFSPTNIVAWTGSISELRKGKGYKTLADNLAYIYGSSTLNAYGAYQNLQSNTEKAINKNGSKKFKVFASCDNLATTGKVSEDGMYTIKPSDNF